jgi:hypothetical protein
MVNMEPYELQFGGKTPFGVREPMPPIWPAGITAVDRLALEDFLQLSSPQRKVVREMIETLVASAVKQKRG